jgi:zinc/manganese transport system substrate-binding protein
MKSLFFIFCMTFIILADKKLNVVASVPDLADMARQIGGDAVSVISLASGREDLHAVPARPSFLPKLNKADLLLTLGLDAEHAWLPPLAAESRNPKVREDGPGWINCFEGIEILGVPLKLDRSEGEQHPEGNPHYNIGPQCGIVMAANIEKAFAKALPSKAEYFALNCKSYCTRIDSLIVRLKEQGRKLDGMAVIEYHPDVAYLCAFYGLETIGSVEPKAGVPPTPSHLKDLEQMGKDTNVKMIVYNQSQNFKIPQKLGVSIGCRSVQIANAVGALPQITTWIELQQYNLNQILSGLSGAAP